MSISAQSAASTPPASERIVIKQSRSSYSPLSKVVTSSSRMALPTESNSDSASCSATPSDSSCANSIRIGTSSRRRRIPLTRLMVDCRRESLLVMTCAASGSSQRFGTDAWTSNSSNSLRRRGRSITFSILVRVALNFSISSGYSRAAMGKE